MNIRQLESDLEQKKAKLAALLEGTLRAAAEAVVKPGTATEPAVIGRLVTDEELAPIKALQAECLAIKAQIDRAQGVAATLADVERLTAGIARPEAVVPASSAQLARLSIGHRFAMDNGIRAFLAAGQHRLSASWQSPVVEGPHWSSFAVLTGGAGSGGALVPPDTSPGLVAEPERRPMVGDLPAQGATTSSVVQYMKETAFTNAAAAVKEGEQKPESALAFTAATAPVRKLAHWLATSEEMLEDVAQLVSIIDARLRYGIELVEEDELLNGGGVDPHLLGFNKLPGLAPAVPAGGKADPDAFLKQIAAIASTSLLVPDAFVINPADWGAMQILKNGQGNYMGSGPFASPQGPMIWGISGVVSPAQPAGIAIVGAFKAASQIFRRSGIAVQASNSHQDFFTKNLVAIRGEERLALAVYREGAFGQVTELTPVVGP